MFNKCKNDMFDAKMIQSSKIIGLNIGRQLILFA